MLSLGDPCVERHPENLRLAVVRGKLDLKHDPLKCDSISIPGLTLDVSIIDAGHVASFACDGAAPLHEVFACVTPKDVPGVPLDGLRGLKQEYNFPGCGYQFKASYLTWRDPEPPAVRNLIATGERWRRSAYVCTLVHELPIGSLQAAAKTVVYAWASPRSRMISLWTLHSYPGVRGLVESRTVVQLKEDAS